MYNVYLNGKWEKKYKQLEHCRLYAERRMMMIYRLNKQATTEYESTPGNVYAWYTDTRGDKWIWYFEKVKR